MTLEEADVSSLDPVVTNEEILVIESVLRELKAKEGTRVDLEGFRVEINERFAEAEDADGKPMGFACDALCYYTNVEGVYIFVPKLHGRVRREADLDRMIHDMVNDSLGLGEGGVLNNDGTTRSAPKSTGLYVPPSARRSSLN